MSEVEFEVRTEEGGQIVWSIEWKRDGGAGLRKATVRYAEADLQRGADWYRNVWQQLTGDDWTLAKSEPADLAVSFWKGAESAGLSRMEGVAAALEQVAAAPRPGAAGSAKMAGTLAQAALPMLGNTVTLDGALLARSAAWLCAAEQQGGEKAGAEWGGLLALAGRGPESRAAWVLKTAPAGASPPLWRSWDFIVRLPAPSAALSEISRQENRRYAAPVFVAYGSINQEYLNLFTKVGKKLYSGKSWESLVDYAPQLNGSTRPPIAESLTGSSIAAWRTVLGKVSKAPGDAVELVDAARAVSDNGKAPPTTPPSAALVSLLNQRVEKGAGKLIPVAVATARDLLVFGWESGGLQYGALHNTVSVIQGGQEKADAIERSWCDAVTGWSAFAVNLKLPTVAPPADTGVYEYILQKHVAAKLIQQPPAAWPRTADAYLRRRWLGDPHRALEFMLSHGGKASEAEALLHRVLHEGSELNIAPLLQIDNHYTSSLPGRDQWRFDQLVDELKMRSEISKAVPQLMPGPLLESDDAAGRFLYAQKMEQLHWKSGLALAPAFVFDQYVRANAPKSAQRFYDRWRESMPDRYAFQHSFGGANFALALLQDEPERAKAALKDIGRTYEGDIEMTGALATGDYAEVERRIDAWLKRTPKGWGAPNYQAFREYLPLIPALMDAKHADHRKAVESFPTKTRFLLQQWILMSRAHLPPEDAIRFFQGDDYTVTSPERQMVIHALEGDVAGFEKLFKELLGPRPDPTSVIYWPEMLVRGLGLNTTFYAWLHNLVLKVPPPKEEPDLQPAGAEPLLPQLLKIAAEP